MEHRVMPGSASCRPVGKKCPEGSDHWYIFGIGHTIRILAVIVLSFRLRDSGCPARRGM